MKHKMFAILTAAVLLLTCGCSLAQEPPENGGLTQGDTLVGVLVTTEYLDLFDMDAWLNDNIEDVLDGEAVVGGDTAKYEGRIYATRTEEGGYEFPENLSGPLYMGYTVTPDEGEPYSYSVVAGGMCDSRSHYTVTDEGQRMELSGTVYFDPYTVPRETLPDAETELPVSQICFYSNPIYQTPEGDVYVVSGMGHSYSVEHGLDSGYFNGTTTFSSKVTETVNGETVELENTVQVSFQGVKLAEEIIVIEMSPDNRQLRAVGYTPEQFPRELTAGRDAAYVIVETHSTVDGERQVNRQIATAGAEDEHIEVFVPTEGGYAARQETKVVWEE